MKNLKTAMVATLFCFLGITACDPDTEYEPLDPSEASRIVADETRRAQESNARVLTDEEAQRVTEEAEQIRREIEAADAGVDDDFGASLAGGACRLGPTSHGVATAAFLLGLGLLLRRRTRTY